jgi:hypothetical protein
MDNNLIATWQRNNLFHLNPSDFNRPVYRFMKYKHLLSMINDSELKIAKISSWDDTYENFFWKSNFNLQDGVSFNSGDILKNFWGQCWTTEKDSVAMWHSYSPDKQSVRIKTTIQKLINAVCAEERDMCLSYWGLVEYKTKNELICWLNEQSPIMSLPKFKEIAKESLFFKRDLFEYENEFRIIFNGDHESDSELKAYKIDVTNFIEEIVFDPRIKPCCRETYRADLMGMSIYANKIRKSALYDLYDFKPAKIQINF